MRRVESPRVFYLDQRKFIPRPKPVVDRPNILDSSDYPGSPLYRPERLDGRNSRSSGSAADRPGLSHSHICSAPEQGRTAQVEIWKGGSLVRCQRSKRPEKKETPERGNVYDFSGKARARMLQLMSKLDREQLPLFVHLTLPGATVVQPDTVKEAFRRLAVAHHRNFSESSGVWKKELAERKSGQLKGQVLPHFHLLVFNVPEKFAYRAYRGDWVHVFRRGGEWVIRTFYIDVFGQKRWEDEIVSGQDRYREWLARMWYEFIGSGELNHSKACHRVEQINTAEGCKRYAAKYLGKEQSWRLCPYAQGRYWGIWSRERLPLSERIVFRLSDQEAVRIHRAMRRLYEKQNPGRKCHLGHYTINFFTNGSEPFERLVAFVIGQDRYNRELESHEKQKKRARDVGSTGGISGERSAEPYCGSVRTVGNCPTQTWFSALESIPGREAPSASGS